MRIIKDQTMELEKLEIGFERLTCYEFNDISMRVQW